MNRDRSLRWLYSTVGFLLLGFSLYLLHQELGRYNFNDILHSLSLIGNRQLSYALGFTFLDYLELAAKIWLPLAISIII